MSFTTPKRVPGGTPGRYSVAEVRAALEADAEARGFGVMPLVVECRRVGQWGEARAPGVYYEDPERRSGPTVVFAGEDPPDALLAPFRPKGREVGPLVIVLGPEEVPPPAEVSAPDLSGGH